MVDNLSDDDWVALITRAEEKGVSGERGAIEFLEFWDTTRHKIKWGKDKYGKQRYRWVEGAEMSDGTRTLGSYLGNAISDIDNQSQYPSKDYSKVPVLQNILSERIEKVAVDEIIKLQEKEDYKELSRLKFKDEELQRQAENRAYNAAEQRKKELVRAKDVDGLKQLRSEIRGTYAEGVISSSEGIDYYINRLEAKNNG